MQPIRATIARTYEVQAAHRLPNVPPGHKCGRLHGHTYVIEIGISGRVDPTLGWIMDFAMLDAIVEQQCRGLLDHYYLNEVPGLENPTSEVMAWWAWQRLSVYGWPDGVTLAHVSISENGRSRVLLTADAG